MGTAHTPSLCLVPASCAHSPSPAWLCLLCVTDQTRAVATRVAVSPRCAASMPFPTLQICPWIKPQWMALSTDLDSAFCPQDIGTQTAHPLLVFPFHLLCRLDPHRLSAHMALHHMQNLSPPTHSVYLICINSSTLKLFQTAKSIQKAQPTASVKGKCQFAPLFSRRTEM